MKPKMLMFNKITSSRYHDKMIRSVKPLDAYFGVNHFWYNRVTYTGHYAYFGTHTEWSAFCSDHPEFIKDIPYLMHPATAQEGVQLLGYTSDAKLQKILDLGRIKYKTNFNLQILKKTPVGVEGFGFGCYDNTSVTYERLLNALPLLTRFIKDFKRVNAPIFSILDAYQMDVKDILGLDFRQLKKQGFSEFDRNQFINKMGINIPKLSEREYEVIEYYANGYPVSYIAEQMSVGKRTIESYVTSLKEKLQCDSKVALIQKAKEITSLFSHDLF